MKTADFDYDLPPELIAQEPAARRDASRLLVVSRQPSAVSHRPSAISPPPSPITPYPSPITHHVFSDLPSFVEPGDVVVINDSRVIPARLLGSREGGGKAEVLLVSREAGGTWRALVRPGSRIRAGSVLRVGGEDRIEIVAHLPEGARRVRLVGPEGEDAVLARRGRIPLPPYIERDLTDLDTERYQTVYADGGAALHAGTPGRHHSARRVRGADDAARGPRHLPPGLR